MKKVTALKTNNQSSLYWNWYYSGFALAASFLLTIVLVKPIGVSTQFVIFDGILANAINPELVTTDETSKSGYSSTNSYLNKSGGKYAKAVANPINYGFIFVISMIAGGWLAAKTQSRKAEQLPIFHRSRFSGNTPLRFCLTFIGGILVLYGARLAGGCTSGHMMSGMMQTAVSGYLFAAAAFALAVPTAILLYGKGGNDQ